MLVLEDDPAFRGLLVELLAEEGFEAALCESYAALREAARAPATGVVLADFWGTSHARLTPCECEQIRELASRAPTILLTARAWAGTIDAQELGLVCILSKPPRLDELVAQVRRCLNLPGDPEENRPIHG